MSAIRMTPEELIEKAKIETSAIAAAGKLNPAQSNVFISNVYDMTQLRNVVRLVRFSNESMNVGKIAVHSRVMILKKEARAAQMRRGISTSQVTLQPVDVTVPWEISDQFGDYNIEGEAIYNTIARLMATQFANDWEEMLLTSNTLGYARLQSDMAEGGSTSMVVKDTTMAAYNGWLVLADAGHLYDAEGEDISSSLLSKMIMTMPRKYRRIKRDMRFLVSMDHEQLYRERKGARQTPAGDEAEVSMNNLRAYGIELVPVPLLDKDPLVVQHVVLGAAPASVTLNYKPIPAGTEFYVTASTLGISAATPFIETTDYTINRMTGVLTSVGGAGMAAGGTYKVTYHSSGQALLTDYQNLIMAIGKDISLEQDRDHASQTNQYFIHARVFGQIEETDAIVKGVNIGLE